MIDSLKKIAVRYWLLVFFTVVALIMVVYQVSFQEMWTTISKLKLWQILVLVALFFMHSVFHIASRKVLLHALNTACGLKNLTYIHFATLAAHYSTPAKIGFPLAVYLLNRFERVPYAIGTAMIIIELTVITGFCALISTIGALTLFMDTVTPIFIGMFGLVLFGVLLLVGIRVMLLKTSPENRLSQYVTKTMDAYQHINRTWFLPYFFVVVSMSILGGVTLWCLSFFYSEEISLWQSVVASSTSFFIGAVSMVPMGLGTRDVSMLMCLQHYGISDGTALSIVTIQRILSTGLGFILGILFGSILGVRNINAVNPVTEKPSIAK